MSVFLQAEDGIRDLVRSRGLGDVYKRQVLGCTAADVAANNSATLYVARRNVEGGGRQQAFENSSFRSLLGVRGAITDTWDYDASVQYSKVKADQRTLNYFKVDRIQRSVNVVADPTTGAPVCMSALDGTDPACVPYNAFQIGGVTQEALDYLQVPGLQQGTIDQTIYQGISTGDLANIGVKSPWASEGIQVAFGAGRYDVPTFLLEGDENYEKARWEATATSIQVLRMTYRFKGPRKNGPALGAIVLNQNWTLSSKTLGGETKFKQINAGITGGYYLDIVPDRERLARYGLSIQDVQEVIAMALGAEAITQTVEGREPRVARPHSARGTRRSRRRAPPGCGQLH